MRRLWIYFTGVWNEEETAEIVVPDVVQTTPTDSVPPELQQVLEETESQEPAADQVLDCWVILND